MEEGTLAKWLVKEGDVVKSGDILAEIETDKATMEFEAVDEGTVAKILVPEGTDGVKVGALIAILAGEGEDASAVPSPKRGEGKGEGAPKPDEPTGGGAPSSQTSPRRGEGAKASPQAAVESPPAPSAPAVPLAAQPSAEKPSPAEGERVKASPLARRLAQAQNIDLTAIQGSGPGGRIVRADIDAAAGKAPAAAVSAPKLAAAAAQPVSTEIPHEAVKLSNMRKTIARRLTEAKQTIPHYYLTVDIQLDALLKLRSELNKGLESRDIKLSVNDLLIKALAMALIEVPTAMIMPWGGLMTASNCLVPNMPRLEMLAVPP
jgi:pyruvate dehydrogenase E2 component (dihydrolipoamide acetyltransferase)